MLKNKTVLITGASSGFGKAMAYRFAKEGCRLILLARRLDRLEALQKELSNNDVHIAQLDICDSKAIKSFVKSIPKSFEDIDLLINNAGLALGLSTADEAELEQWETMIETNIKGLITMTRCIVPNMVKNKSGHVINIGSTAGSWPYPGGNVYGASKAFVRQFSLNLRADLAPKGIRVTNIEPGLSETEFSLVRFSGEQDKADKIYEGCDALQAEDIAESVYWAASQPSHVNINTLELMPSCQSWAALNVKRDTK